MSVAQSRHATGDSSRFSTAGRQVVPPSSETSTLTTPRSPAQATPASLAGRRTLPAEAGTSMRDSVLTLATSSQPRTSQ